MNNVEVPRPELIFDNMTQSDIREFGENSAEYITVVDSDCVLVLNLCPEFLIVYEIYCTFDEIPRNVMHDLRDYGYKIIYSDKKLSDKFSKDMGVPVDYQEGAKLSEVIPRITGAIKKQTENIFAKN